MTRATRILYIERILMACWEGGLHTPSVPVCGGLVFLIKAQSSGGPQTKLDV